MDRFLSSTFKTVHLFLVAFVLCIFISSNSPATEKGKVLQSQVLPLPYSYGDNLDAGLYYSLGSFRELENAFSLRLKWLKLKPAFNLSIVKYKAFYRAIVGPVVKLNKNKIKKNIHKLGVKNFFSVRINSSDKLIKKNTTYTKTTKPIILSKMKLEKHILIEPKGKNKSKAKRVLVKPSLPSNKLEKLPLSEPNLKQNKITNKTNNNSYKVGDNFSDCKLCPEQVVLPAGNFIMGGSSKGDLAVNAKIPKVFTISKHEISFNLWEACIDGGGCGGHRPSDEGWGRGQQPVINVSWRDALGYVEWLSKKTEKRYRLPSEIEWEYAAKAGSTSGYWWGEKLGINQAVCFDCGSKYDGEQTAQVGSFAKNNFGLFDTAGNVWEWTANCFNKNSYQISSKNLKPLSAYETPSISDECSRVLRGGGWDTIGIGIKSSFRFASGPSNRSNVFGFRVVREIE